MCEHFESIDLNVKFRLKNKMFFFVSKSSSDVNKVLKYGNTYAVGSAVLGTIFQ